MTKTFKKSDSIGLIIGRNPVLEALKFDPQSIEKISILLGLTDKKIKLIEHEAKRKNIIIEYLGKPLFQKLFDQTNKSEGISQGIIAVTGEFKYTSLEDILTENKTKSALILLDEIHDPHNLGAIIRTAAAGGIDAVIITEKNSAKVNHTVIKTSSGAVNFIKIALIQNIYKTIEFLKKEGYTVIGADNNSESDVYKYNFPGKSVLIFGNEGEGIRKNIIKLCDKTLKIPVSGKIESLNVSVSAGIIIFELLRQKNY